MSWGVVGGNGAVDIYFLEPKQNKEETSVSKSMSDVVRKTFPRYLVFVLDHPSLSLTPVWSDTTQMRNEKMLVGLGVERFSACRLTYCPKILYHLHY